jgi:hypothetical protein
MATDFEGNLYVNLGTTLAGERNPGTPNEYQAFVPEAVLTRADIGTTETLITDAPALLVAVIPNAGHTGNVSIRDAAAISGGSTPKLVLDLLPGEPCAVWGAKFANGITVDGSDAACDVTLIWRPQ